MDKIINLMPKGQSQEVQAGECTQTNNRCKQTYYYIPAMQLIMKMIVDLIISCDTSSMHVSHYLSRSRMGPETDTMEQVLAGWPAC